MPISIYPPVLATSQPAFIPTTKYKVYFDTNPLTSWSDVKHVQLRVMKQSNNRSIVNTSIFPDGTIYIDKDSDDDNLLYDEDVGKYQFIIRNTWLAENWQPGYLYKVQVRFGSSYIWSTLGQDFATWQRDQVNNENFSEWSTVMLIKCIDEPRITLAPSSESLNPTFYGSFYLDSGNNEAEGIYRFILFDEDMNEIETSGWIRHNQYSGSADIYRFKTVLIDGEIYSVRYDVQTVNGYEKSSNIYTFTAQSRYQGALAGIALIADDQDNYCFENGCINLYLDATNTTLNGRYVLSRAAENSGFRVYQDIQFFDFPSKLINAQTFLFRDFYIESGMRYKYALQQVNSAGTTRTNPLYENGNPARSVDFDYTYLLRDGVQLKLQFNNNISSFKHTVLQSKQDTLGSQFPFISRNGIAYYAEFPIQGLISFAMDADHTFLEAGEDGYYFNNQLIIPYTNFEDDEEFTINRDLTRKNIFIERKFREQVEKFLNDFNYKLFKSPTEGNVVIVLQNVQLTSESKLGRMIYSFSATAYEVGNNDLETLIDKGILVTGGKNDV